MRRFSFIFISLITILQFQLKLLFLEPFVTVINIEVLEFVKQVNCLLLILFWFSISINVAPVSEQIKHYNTNSVSWQANAISCVQKQQSSQSGCFVALNQYVSESRLLQERLYLSCQTALSMVTPMRRHEDVSSSSCKESFRKH